MRRLTLRKETLTELCPDDLALVAGGTTRTTQATTVVASTAVACLSDMLANCDSNLRPCVSNTCTR